MTDQSVNAALETIRTVARTMNPFFNDTETIWPHLNSLEPATLQKIQEMYRGGSQPVNLVREYVAWMLLKGETWGLEAHKNLLNAIRQRDAAYFDDFRKVDFSSKTKDPFRSWANPARIYLPFLYRNEQAVTSGLDELARDLKTKLGRPTLNVSTWDFNGPNNFGQETAALAVYPENRTAHQLSWQLFTEINWMGLRYGLMPGSELKAEAATLADADTWDQVVEGFKHLLQAFDTRNQETRRVWQWAPGESGRYWEEFDKAGLIAIGFENLNNLNNYPTRSDLAEALGIPNRNKSNDLSALEFFRDAAVGDLIVARQGRRISLGIGILEGPYEYRPERPYYPHVRKCRWITEKVIDFGSSIFRADTFFTTRKWPQVFKEYSRQDSDFTAALQGGAASDTIQADLAKSMTTVARDEELVDLVPQNVILYGPPGTGKTYATVDWALTCIESKDLETIQQADRVERRKRFLQYADAKFIQFVTFHPSLSYEDFVEGIKPVTQPKGGGIQYAVQPGLFRQICSRAESNWLAAKAGKAKLDQFVLIIDEINRGNVAQILGELITLLEVDKRLGSTEAPPMILPYSRDEFGVPPNLHIIATMNTADRSVEALDAALRRRFTFHEMTAELPLLTPEACESRLGKDWDLGDLDLSELLSVINYRLLKLIDRDHTLGHAFFLKVANLDDLRGVFANKVIPQLQEFFYGNGTRIGLVLGPRFVQRDLQADQTTFARFEADVEDAEDRPIYTITPMDQWDLEAFKAIYL